MINIHTIWFACWWRTVLQEQKSLLSYVLNLDILEDQTWERLQVRFRTPLEFQRWSFAYSFHLKKWFVCRGLNLHTNSIVCQYLDVVYPYIFEFLILIFPNSKCCFSTQIFFSDLGHQSIVIFVIFFLKMIKQYRYTVNPECRNNK